MQRKMLGFHQDEEGHWVAELACGHTQHVRHQPPFTLRPWTVTAEGRAERVGQPLDCPLCDRREMRGQSHCGLQDTVPFFGAEPSRQVCFVATTRRRRVGECSCLEWQPGVLRSTATGETRTELRAGARHPILPEVEHRVAASDDVEFVVEFWRSG